MRRTIAARQLIRAGQIVDYPLLTVENGTVIAIDQISEEELSRENADHRFSDGVIAPSYVDVHVHGGYGHDVMEGTPEALNVVGSFLARHGVGAYLPTTVTSPEDETLRALSKLAARIGSASDSSAPAATPLGIHLEGPFLSAKKRGVHPEALLRAPSVAAFQRLWEAAEGKILLMTIAPELPGALEVIEFATSLGVRCSLGHTNATYTEAETAYRAGARSATHTFNAMRPLDHRDPGVIAFVLDQPELFAEIIADGYHVDPAMVRLFCKAKGEDRSILITDGISAAGMPDGQYKLGDLDVEVIEGRCTYKGAIAGSTLKMDLAVRNFAAFTGAPLGGAVKAASANPAALIGQQENWGQIEVGRAANLTILSTGGEVLETFVRGVPVGVNS